MEKKIKLIVEIPVDDCYEQLDLIDNAPTIEDRPKGEWIECGSSDHWKCDKCGHPAPLESRDCEWLSGFCPNCGAEMKGGVK